MKRRHCTPLLICCIFCSLTNAQIKVSDNNRYLTTHDKKPFFWLGDTAWELFHRLTREEAEAYLRVRKQQGYNVIQAVSLAEINGLREPNRYGDLPLIEEVPGRLAVTPGADPADAVQYDYWDHVSWVINKAAELGMYVGLLPTWGDKVAHLWGEGPIVFTPDNAEIFGAALAKRYGSHWNVLWIVGGDRPVMYKSGRQGVEKEYNDLAVWRAMARGIEGVVGREAFISYHPSGGPNSSSQHIHTEEWLDMNAFQSGHGARETPAWEWVKRDLALQPQKPTLDMEPCYEDHPVNFWDGKWTKEERGYFTAYDVRARVYRGVFAGACGFTYGHHHVWQFADEERYPMISKADKKIHWRDALHAPAAEQMQHLKNLLLSRPYFSRVADNGIVVSDKGSSYVDLLLATRDKKGTYAMVYLPQNKAVSVDMGRISGGTKNIWWFNPRTGEAIKHKSVWSKSIQTFLPPKEGEDWVLVIDDASRHYKTPGNPGLSN
ncbi:glycoside hydrolase family 140 protein [Cesiribacter sp. SM1]|uniref:glycoside hydrolase family 140 protein n=1 Tax=Cesiribacter sp. SM1 TaxID=2861196 RepID=UPI001CD3E2E6|nr:glycoside hydrolase family 140 protein [Cesiribacter sp. SM1]